MAQAHAKITAPQVVLVLGKTGVGKSTFIKAATSLDVEVGDSLADCKRKTWTHHVQDIDGTDDKQVPARFRFTGYQIPPSS